MSDWARAHVAVNIVVMAPMQRQAVRAGGQVARIGLTRRRRKIPATTIVLECSRAETGVGPSIAAGSHGWRPIWADFPAAARMNPNKGRLMSWVCAAVMAC